MFTIFKRLKTNTFFQTYFLVLLPIVILSIFVCIVTIVYTSHYTGLLKDTYTYQLELHYEEHQAQLQNAITSIHMLARNNTFADFMKPSETAADAHTIRQISDMLLQIIEENASIDSISILDRSNHLVLTNNSVYDMETYFNSIYKYTDYNFNFFMYYKAPFSSYQTLSPTMVTQKTGAETVQKSIIPIIFTQIGDIRTSNILVLNVDITKVLQKANNEKITKNSNFLIVNKQTGQTFDIHNSANKYISDIYYQEMINFFSIFDYTDEHGAKNLIISYSPRKSMLGYSYAVAVPYTDIYSTVFKFTSLVALLGILIFGSTLFVAYISTKKIYNPLKSIAALFNKKGTPPGEENIVKYIQNSISDTLKSNIDLQNTVTQAMPIIQERCLLKLLSGNEYSSDLEAALTDSGITFRYSYFSSVIIKLRPTQIFYKTYTNLEYNLIKAGIYNVVKSMLNEYDIYIIQVEDNTLFVLLNLETDTEYEHILKKLHNLEEIMEHDKDFMQIHMGAGHIYPHLEGMQRSHREALNAISAIPGLNQLKVNVDTVKQVADKIDYIFRMNDENNLFTCLMAGNTQRAKELIDQVIAQNMALHLPERTMMQLYIQIIYVIFKVMRIKNIPITVQNSDGIDIITSISTCPLNEVYDTIHKLISHIGEYFESEKTELDIHAVVEYINQNYNKILSLESIADHFHTTPKYTSKFIKEHLGLPYVEYLASLRIDKAKALLCNTDKSIAEIYEMVGFNNRNTFIRTFKKITGVTPSDYRKFAIK